MDYLTFTTVHTMVILSLCGVVYLSKQFVALIKWLAEIALKDWNEDKKENNL